MNIRRSGEVPGMGVGVAALLAGAWRSQVDPPELDAATIEAAVPLLLSTGAGPLAWHRLRGAAASSPNGYAELRAAYRLSALQAQVRALETARAVEALHSASVPALLVKGWAAARLYPDPALRPYGDVDLLVHPDALSAGRAVAAALPEAEYPMEVHAAGAGAYRVLPPGEWESIVARAPRATIGGAEVFVPSPEDHLRLLVSHLLTHGAWRPLWLCDVAAALETRSPEWDWSYFLRGTDEQREWLVVGLRLASILLSADLGRMPEPMAPEKVPRWIRDTVLRQWSLGPGGSRLEALSTEYLRHLGSPRRIWTEVRRHWPNPIQAAYELGARPGPHPPRGTQEVAALRRAPRILRRRPGGI